MYPGRLVAASPPIFNFVLPMERTEMSNEQTSVKPVPQPAVNVAYIAGRIYEKRRATEHIYTIVTLPAPDEYSAPMVAEIRSTKSIGDKGEDVKIPVRLGGFRSKPYKYTNDDGEVITRRPVNNAFIAIEQ